MQLLQFTWQLFLLHFPLNFMDILRNNGQYAHILKKNGSPPISYIKCFLDFSESVKFPCFVLGDCFLHSFVIFK